VYRIERSPRETVSLVRRALTGADVDEVYVEGNVVMGTMAVPGGDRPLWIVEVDLGAPSAGDGTLVSVAVRFNDDLVPGRRLPSGVGSAPQVGRRVVDELRSAAGEDFYRVPGPEDATGSVDGWERLGADERLSETGMRSMGKAVYEVSTGGRVATVSVVRPERHDAGHAVAVSTPLSVARAGTGFECYFDDGDEFTRYDYGDHGVDLPEDVWQSVRSLSPFGLLVVDDRLGTAEHVLPTVVTDPGTLLEHARTVVSLVEAVERAVESTV